tara:strand:- start:5125 stop:5703 length:579 start_codon:yes stop_codon:yes gene_type:complete
MKKLYFAISNILALRTIPVYGAEAGMPQLDPEFWVAQIFWLVLIFLSLYLVIWKIFLPRITTVVENRKLKIVNDLNEAQKLKESAENKLNEYNKIIEKSKKEAIKIIQDSKKKLDADIESKKQKFVEEIEKELTSAENEIKNLKKTSAANINKIAIEISNDILKKIIGTDLNLSSVSAAVEDVSKRKMGKSI